MTTSALRGAMVKIEEQPSTNPANPAIQPPTIPGYPSYSKTPMIHSTSIWFIKLNTIILGGWVYINNQY